METAERNDPIHTRCNIEDSDRTLILNRGTLDGGTAWPVKHNFTQDAVAVLQEARATLFAVSNFWWSDARWRAVLQRSVGPARTGGSRGYHFGPWPLLSRSP